MHFVPCLGRKHTDSLLCSPSYVLHAQFSDFINDHARHAAHIDAISASMQLCCACPLIVLASIQVCSAMGTKAPLQERHLENFNMSAMDAEWRRGGPQADASTLKSTMHLSVKTERENSGKRSRDPQPKQNLTASSAGPSDSKKSRGLPAPGKGSKKKPAPALPPGRPHLARRVGGIAPNGNPQCWYAPHESEVDPHRIAQRMKQVEFGKNSAGYKAYVLAVPRCDCVTSNGFYHR